MELDSEIRQQLMHQSSSNIIVLDSVCKAYSVLSKYDNVAVSISGGKDSDIMLDLIYRLDTNREARYFFCDTGLEYAATKRHLTKLEEKYGIKIERIKAIKPIPTSCREHGIPFLSKLVSNMISSLQKHNFQWEDEPYESLIEKYPKCKSSLKWWCNKRGTKGFGFSMFNINYNKGLKEFIIANPVPFKVSSKCCEYAKKKVSANFIKENDIDLMIVGVRKAEGGIRSASYKTCWDNNTDKCSQYRPLFWYRLQDEIDYENIFGVNHSECYTEWGFRRTGCVGCPFSKHFDDELSVVKEREPQMYKACNNIFGVSYEYTRKYQRFKKAMKEGKLIEIGGKKYCIDDLLEE